MYIFVHIIENQYIDNINSYNQYMIAILVNNCNQYTYQ